MKIQFSIYDVNRCYGGPQEGGWWFDAYHHVKSFERDIPLVDVMSWQRDEEFGRSGNPIGDHLKALDRLVHHMNEADGKWRPLDSVLSNGKYIVLFEETPGENQTRECPQYC